MASDKDSPNSHQSNDLEDIEIVKNLLELQSRLAAKTRPIENE